MTIKNNFEESVIAENSLFELFDNKKGKKQIFLENSLPLKYASIVRGSELDFSVDTKKPGTKLEMMLLCPIIANTPLSVNVKLNINHNNCDITLHMIAFVLNNEKTTLDATIYMKPNIQNSKSSLLEESLILNDEVQIKNLPVLDIHARNIQASHGAKIYRLDKEKLFYLQSKGLSFKMAQDLLIASYAKRLFEGFDFSQEEEKDLMSDFLTFNT